MPETDPVATDPIAIDRPSSSKGLILVTGGSRGIGRAASVLLARRGYDVAINYKSDSQSAKTVVDQITSERMETAKKASEDQNCSSESTENDYFGRAISFQADVSEEDAVKALFLDIRRVFGRDPTGLVNNAGILGPRESEIVNITASDMQDVFQTNVYGPFYCTREFVRLVSTKTGGQGGSVVNVSSVSAKLGNPLAYAMSKGALDSMMAGLAKSLPKQGIRINSVVPGGTDTDMITEDFAREMIKVIPMGRIGRPEEIAEGILFLISSASSYCSGASIRMAGGRPAF